MSDYFQNATLLISSNPLISAATPAAEETPAAAAAPAAEAPADGKPGYQCVTTEILHQTH